MHVMVIGEFTYPTMALKVIKSGREGKKKEKAITTLE